MQTVHLIGAEDVRSAGNRMSDAAAEMNRAASNIGYAIERHAQAMEDFISRFEAAVEKLKEK